MLNRAKFLFCIPILHFDTLTNCLNRVIAGRWSLLCYQCDNNNNNNNNCNAHPKPEPTGTRSDKLRRQPVVSGPQSASSEAAPSAAVGFRAADAARLFGHLTTTDTERTRCNTTIILLWYRTRRPETRYLVVCRIHYGRMTETRYRVLRQKKKNPSLRASRYRTCAANVNVVASSNARYIGSVVTAVWYTLSQYSRRRGTDWGGSGGVGDGDGDSSAPRQCAPLRIRMASGKYRRENVVAADRRRRARTRSTDRAHA